MTNLLPPAAKKQIVFEYWTRVVCAWIILWSICLLIGLVVLFPTYMLLVWNNDVQEASAVAATERSTEYETLTTIVQSATTQAEDIVRISRRTSLTAIMDDIWGAVQPNQIAVTSISVFQEEAELQPITVRGEANDRQALAAFRDQLEQLPFVTSVDLPIENLASNQDITFTLTVLVAPNTL